MRTVIYTDDLEPITVINLSEWAVKHLTETGYITFPVYPEYSFEHYISKDEAPTSTKFHEVVLRIEKFVRKNKETFFVFADDETSALLLESIFLPGQRKTLKNEKAEAFSKGFLHALQRLG